MLVTVLLLGNILKRLMKVNKMASTTLVEKTKKALRVSTTAFDDQISDLLDSALLDLGVAGVEIPESIDALVSTAAISYVRIHFGSPDDYDRWKRSYDEQKAQLASCTGYTDWLVV